MNTLPPLREELALLPGPALKDGQPSWMLHDPIRNRFFRIDWPSFELLKRWHLADVGRVLHDLTQHTTLELDQEEIRRLAQFLLDNQLTQPAGPRDIARLTARREQARQSPLTWLIHHYLFFRIPLLRPDAWLNRWVRVLLPLYSQGFMVATLLALTIGVLQVVRQWDSFVAQMVDTFTLSGVASYVVALMSVKLLHELGHAFTAKRYGCRVPSMGIAFVVMWPMAYTDTNDAWRLRNASNRLRVASAGIVTELIVAAWSTLAWVLLPDGSARSAAFFLATTSWVTTLAINASPFMRFDGYFILCDFLDEPNLHDRSFALARWKLREWLFGLREPAPELQNAKKLFWMITFAWLTWIYRLVLFVGIALLVYHLFFKVLGIILFTIEIAWFILRPLRNELNAWTHRRQQILQGGRIWVSLLMALLLIACLFIPWPGLISAQALIRPTDTWPLHSPQAARLDALPFRSGDPVSPGDIVASLHMPDLQAKRRLLTTKIEQLRWQLEASAVDPEGRSRLLGLREQLATALSELASLDTEIRNFHPVAPFQGTFITENPELSTGQWLSKRELIGQVVKTGSTWIVETWLDEHVVRRLSPDDRARFVMESGVGPVLPLSVRSIDRDATRVLPRLELSALAGGHILTREKNGQHLPEQAVYRVTFTVEGTPDPGPLIGRSGRGQVVVQVAAEAPALRYLRQAAAVVIREFGF